MSLRAVSDIIRRREVSVIDVVGAVLERVEAVDNELHSLITVDAVGTWQAAEEADATLLRNEKVGPLHGVPMTVKDHFATRGLRTTVASGLFATHIPQFDAAVVERVRGAGALVIGKANMYELGTGWGTHGYFPLAVNPWDPQVSPGGSSSGSAVGVAAGMGYASVASDGGGSTRVPANYCGVVGLKPTHGRVSFYGSIPSAPTGTARAQTMSKTISAAGIITRGVEDAAMILQALAGWDPRDFGAEDLAVPNYVEQLPGEIRGLVVGVPWPFIEQSISRENGRAFEDALVVLRDAGGTIVDLAPPEALRWIGWMWTTIAYVEMATLYEDRYRTSPDDFGPELQDRIRVGLATSASEYFMATQARAQLRAEWMQLFKVCDVVVTPTAPAGPPTLGELLARRGDLQDIGELARYTRPYNMTGLPAITVPDGVTTAGLPLGLQVGGRPFDEATVLRVADAYERRTQWHLRHPPISVARGERGPASAQPRQPKETERSEVT